MKIITLHSRVNIALLFDHLQQNLNTIFKQRRQTGLIFKIGRVDNAIEIRQPELYGDEVLFRIEIKGQELWMTRSENYVDDVNSLTVESILNELFKDLSDENSTDLLQEG